MSTGPESFRIRSLSSSLYLPNLLFAIGQGATIPVVALFARWPPVTDAGNVGGPLLVAVITSVATLPAISVAGVGVAGVLVLWRLVLEPLDSAGPGDNLRCARERRSHRMAKSRSASRRDRPERESMVLGCPRRARPREGDQ